MSVKKLIRDTVIGRKIYIESQSDFKKVMFSGQFALINISIFLIHLIVHLAQDVYITLPVSLIAIALCYYSIVCHRQGKHLKANYILLPTINITVYLFAASESPSTGSCLFFIVTAIAAFAVVNYEQRLFSILFAICSYFLFLFAYFFGFSILPKRDYSEDLILFSMIINFTIAMPVLVLAIYMMTSINHHNALQSLESKKLLIKTNAELDRFVYSTSHDLRAPITSVMGLIDITQRSSDGQEIKQYLGMMKDRLHSLDNFIKDVTDYSRNNRLNVTRERFKLYDMATEIWDGLKYKPEAEDINFEIDVAENLEVHADKKRLSIVLNNLLSNAIRYHDQRKEKKYIRVSHQVNGQGFYIKVEDNGQGIAPEYHNKIFEMFYRGNESSNGSGLGLYIVKETMIKLSGTINVQSQPRLGSTFTAKFPY
jgi:signal transduction histidine kinase